PHLRSFPTRRSSDLLPIGRPLVRQVKLRSDAIGQLARSRHKVGMNVRLRSANDAQALGLRGVEVGSHVTAWIDDDRLAALLATEDRKSTRLNSSHVK